MSYIKMVLTTSTEYKTVVTDAMDEAFTMSNNALNLVKMIQNGGVGANQPQMNLREYLFHESTTDPALLNTMNCMLLFLDPEYLLTSLAMYTQINQYKTFGNPAVLPPEPAEPNFNDVLVFCDFSRYIPNYNGISAAPGIAYDSVAGVRVAMSDDFLLCNTSTSPDKVMAVATRTDPTDNRISGIQICPAYLNSFTSRSSYSIWVSPYCRNSFGTTLTVTGSNLFGSHVEGQRCPHDCAWTSHPNGCSVLAQ